MENKQGEAMTDTERESLIELTGLMSMQGSKTVRMWWWNQMVKLISERSPEQIARMEVAKGLRAA